MASAISSAMTKLERAWSGSRCRLAHTLDKNGSLMIRQELNPEHANQPR